MEPSHISSLPSPPSPTFASENDRRTLQQLLQARPDLKFGLHLVEPSWLPGEDESPALSLQVTVSQRPNDTYPGRRGESNSLGTGLNEIIEQTAINTIVRDLTALLDRHVAKTYKRWEKPDRALIGGCCSTSISQLKSDINRLVSHYARNLPRLPESVLEKLSEAQPNPPNVSSCQADTSQQAACSLPANPGFPLVTRGRVKASDYPCEYPCCVIDSVLTNPLTRVEFGKRLQRGEASLQITCTQNRLTRTLETKALWVDAKSAPITGAQAQLEISKPIAARVIAHVINGRRKGLEWSELFTKDDMKPIIEDVRKTVSSDEYYYGKLRVFLKAASV